MLFMLTEQLYISKPILLQEILFNSQLQLLKVFHSTVQQYYFK